MVNEKYIPGSAAFFKSEPGDFIVYNFLTKKTSQITESEAYQYSQLSGIKTIDQHKNKLMNQYDNNLQTTDYEKLLSYFKKNKFLYSLSEFKNQSNNTDSIITLITSDRPELLSCALKSIAEKIFINHKDLPVAIFDDSTGSETRKINKNTGRKIEDKYGLRTFYFGIKEKLQFIDLLSLKTEEKNVSIDILEFAILGSKKHLILKGPGGNRNTALLKLAGKKIISFDDDIQFIFTTKYGLNNDIEISDLKDPDGDLFYNMDKAKNNMIISEVDPINYIAGILGETLKTLIKKTEINNGLFFTDNFRPELLFNPVSKVSTIKAAIFGIYGGRWYSRPFGIYLNNNLAKKNVYGKKSEYRSIKEKPFSLMLSQHLTLSRAPFFVATAMGIDAEEILPPFPPYGRNQDGIWASVMLALNQNAFISHIPFAIYHEMNNKRFFTEMDYEDTTAGFGMITVLIIEQCRRNCFSLYRKINYELLGNELFKLSQISDKRFISICHDLWLGYTGNIIYTLEKKLGDNQRKPKHWAKDVDKHIALLEEQSLKPENALPRELRIHYSTKETIRTYKMFLKNYGNLLKKWPIIWEEAYKLNKEKGKKI